MPDPTWPRRALAPLAASFLSGTAVADEAWPTRPLRIVVPFSAGGSTDIMGRTVAERLTARLGQQMVVENRPGGATNIAAEHVVKSAPDGYTLLWGAAAMSVNPSLLPSMPYDLFRDLAPIAVTARIPLVLTVHPDLPVRSVTELVALSKTRPGGLSFGSGGVGTIPHLATELLASLSGARMAHVPYRGQAAAMPDLLSGRLPVMMEGVPPLLEPIRSGRLRAIGVAELRPLAVLPDVPPIAAAGYPGFEASAWNALWAPAGTPGNVIARLNREVNAIIAEDATRARFAELGAIPGGGSPAEMTAFLRAEVARWAEVIRRSGASAG